MKAHPKTFAALVFSLAMLVLGGASAPANGEGQVVTGCYTFDGRALGTLHIFQPLDIAVQAVRQIAQATGVQANFEIYASDVPNACATMLPRGNGAVRVILYNPNFMSSLGSLNVGVWAPVSVVAHEIGHHVRGHIYSGSAGSTPQRELEADQYAGFAIRRLNGSLESATAAINAISDDVGSATHPARSYRLAAIQQGWMQANQGTAGPSRPQPTEPYVIRLVFNGDARGYFVTNTGRIVGVDLAGQQFSLGAIQPTRDARFQGLYVTNEVTYGVDPQGRVWGWDAAGRMLQVGYGVRL